MTGASGCIGRYLVRNLCARGAKVIAVVRNPSKVEFPPEVEVARGDLTAPGSLAAAVTDADFGIHNAGLISVGRSSRAELWRVNVDGTRAIFQQFAAAGVKRAVLVSSAHAYRPKRDHTYSVGDPTWAAETPGNRMRWYGISKAAAESEAGRIADERGVELVVARPHQVYGAFDTHGFTGYFAKMMKAPLTVWFTHVYLPSVYAGDLAEAVTRMLEVPAAAGKTYNVAGRPGNDSWWDHYRAWRTAGGPRRLVIPVPAPIRRALDISTTERDLNWHPRPLTQGFRELLELERSSA